MTPEPASPTPPPEDSEEMQLCPGCVTPNPELAHFCAKCGAPLTGYAATGPFERLFAEGYVYRQAVERPRRLIVVLGMWMIFGTLPACVIPLLFTPGGSSVEVVIFSAFITTISLMMIWKTTRNYLKRPPQVKLDED